VGSWSVVAVYNACICHVVVKQKLYKHLLIGKAVRAITAKTVDLGCKYDKAIN